MTRLTQSAALGFATSASVAPKFMDLLRRHFARTEAALVGQSSLSAVKPETIVDTGLSAAELTGAPTHDPALPFFCNPDSGAATGEFPPLSWRASCARTAA
jgi:hypothetical protein